MFCFLISLSSILHHLGLAPPQLSLNLSILLFNLYPLLIDLALDLSQNQKMAPTPPIRLATKNPITPTNQELHLFSHSSLESLNSLLKFTKISINQFGICISKFSIRFSEFCLQIHLLNIFYSSEVALPVLQFSALIFASFDSMLCRQQRGYHP